MGTTKRLSPGCLTASSSNCSGGSSRRGRSTTDGSVPVLHSYTVELPRLCTYRSIGSTCSSGLQQSARLTLPTPPRGARASAHTAEAATGSRVETKTQMGCGKNTGGEDRTAEEHRPTVPLLEGHGGPLPFTHEAHTGLVQVDGFAQGLSPCPDLSQLTRQVLHQGQQLSSDVVSLQRMEEEA